MFQYLHICQQNLAGDNASSSGECIAKYKNTENTQKFSLLRLSINVYYDYEDSRKELSDNIQWKSMVNGWIAGNNK